jgi:asparagine synthase (glutamine-hydrolysing)
MSVQAGVFYFDRRPVDPSVVALMGQALDPYGPDGRGEFVEPGLVMVHRALHITPEDAFEQQPFTSRRGKVMTWDGRLDNREDLLLQLWHELREDTTDVSLAMAVYEKWGTEGFAKLIGDWSLVVWDTERQAVVMASDYMGVRPLHYYLQRDFVSWSTTIECLVHLHQLYNEIEPRFLVGFLTAMRPSRMTPYKSVLAPHTGHGTSFDRSGTVDAKRFWNLGSSEIRYRSALDYQTQMRTLFFNGVRSRLRSSRPVWAQLSGGLDSSAVVCAADVLIRQGSAVAPDLNTISFVTDGTPETDESRFIACVEEQRGRASYQIQLNHALDCVDDDRLWITPSHPPAASLKARDLIHRAGGRVLLTGVGGDTVMGNFLDYHFDVARLLQSAKLLSAIGLARHRAIAAKRSIWDVLYSAAKEILPPDITASRMLSQLFASCGGHPPPTVEHVAEAFLLKPFFAGWWRDEWFNQFSRGLLFDDLAHRRAASEIILMAERRHAHSPSDEPFSMTSHPFLDRRLVEFMLGIPFGVVAPPGQPRALMRGAFAPFMPPKIIARFSKGYDAPSYVRDSKDLLLKWVSRTDDLKLLQYDFLDRSLLTQYLATLLHSEKRPPLFVLLVKLEQWLESRERYIQDVFPTHFRANGRP